MYPTSTTKSAATTPSKATARRRDVVLAAYQTLAETGFEGLRMRAIAKRAGMDHATLHYYFDGKEALIHGVLKFIVEELSIGQSRETESTSLRPRARLAAHFRELAKQMHERPEMFVVLAEINVRSMRDPTIRAIVSEYDKAWKQFLSNILAEGIRQKEFRSHLEPNSAADAILCLVRGLSIRSVRTPTAVEGPLQQLMGWLDTLEPF